MNMLATIVAKSDQLNSDDLIGGRALTIKVTKVAFDPTKPDQPVSIFYDGDQGKLDKPCKSMRRVLVNVWGPDANAYVERSMTLYRDDGVQFGGMAVGGIRIANMSHIDKPVTMALTATRANRKPFTVKPLVEVSAAQEDKQADAAGRLIATIEACADEDALHSIINDPQKRAWREKLEKARPELEKRIADALGAAYTRLAAPETASGSEAPVVDADGVIQEEAA